MSQRARIGIVIVFFGLVLGGIGIYFLSRIVQQTITPPPAPTPLPPVTEQIVVAARDLELGALLRLEDLNVVEFAVELVPRNAMRNLESVVGRFSTVPLVSGEMVLDHHLADPTNVSGDLAFILGDDQVLMAFPPNDLMSSLQVIQRGDIVDLLVTTTEDVRVVDETGRQVVDEEGNRATESRTVTFNAMQRLQITAIVADVVQTEEGRQTTISGTIVEGTPQPAPTPAATETQIRAYLLAFSPQDALVVKHLLDRGATFDMVLRSPTSTEIYDVLPVMPEYLLDKYQLELLK